MMIKKGIIVLVLLVFFMPFISALSIEINASLNYHNTTFYNIFFENASSGFDVYDFPALILPSNYSSLYSQVGSTNLAIDSWNNSYSSTASRTLNLTYYASESPNGTLILRWNNSLFNSSLTGTLSDYGNDSSYGSLFSTVNMASVAFFSVVNNNSYRYFKLLLGYATLYCGDGVCSSSISETCSSCSGDCGACGSGETPGGGGGGGCVDSCNAGERQCSGEGYKTCGNYDSDSCLEWSGANSCGVGTTCSNGNCIGQCVRDDSCSLNLCYDQTCKDSCGNEFNGKLNPFCQVSSLVQCGQEIISTNKCSCNTKGSLCSEAGYECVEDKCVYTGCTPQCVNKQCGEDGCGGLCGSCYGVSDCILGVCVARNFTTIKPEIIIGELFKDKNETIYINETKNETLKGEYQVNIKTTQYSAVVGSPVKWEKIILVSSEEGLPVEIKDFTLNLPKSAGDIKVVKFNSLIDSEEEISFNVNKKNKIQARSAVIDSDSGVVIEFFTGIIEGIRGASIAIYDFVAGTGQVSVVLQESVFSGDNLKVEYYTEAPYIREISKGTSKSLTVVGPEDVHYKEVNALIKLPHEIEDYSGAKLVWRTEGERRYVEAKYIDSDKNGLYDSITWMVPQLSEQNYEWLTSSKASHLDSDRQIVSDIYSAVEQKEGYWSETVADGEYLRFTFDIPLKNGDIIKIYAKNLGADSSNLKTYSAYRTQEIAEQVAISSEGFYEIILSGLTAEQSIFDFQVISEGEGVIFDYIEDSSFCPSNMLGRGTSENPCMVSTCTQLQAVNYTSDFKFYSLGNNVDCYETKNWNNGAGFVPLYIASGFDGSYFDGRGYNITGIFMNTSENYAGLFSKIYSKVEIKDLGLVELYIRGYSGAGGIVAYTLGDITNCFVQGNIQVLAGGTFSEGVGGLVGRGLGRIRNSYFKGIINSVSNSVGGLVGWIGNFNVDSTFEIIDSYVIANVTGAGDSGGLIGLNYDSRIINSYFKGSMMGYNVGGLIGNSQGFKVIIDNSYSSGVFNGYNSGGIAGFFSSGIIKNSYSSSYISYKSSTGVFGGYAGGIVAHGGGLTIQDSYSIGTIGSYSIMGGIVGRLNDYADSGGISYFSRLENVYSNMNLSGYTRVGGLVGEYSYSGNTDLYRFEDSFKITNSYFSGSIRLLDNKYLRGDLLYAGGLIASMTVDVPVKISNSFSTGKIKTPSGSSVGGLVGKSFLSPYNFIVDNFYWYDYSDDSATFCYAGSSNGCAKIDNSNGGLDYFKNSVYPSKLPFSSWNFFENWQERIGDYPSLTWQKLGENLISDNERELNSCQPITRSNFIYSLTKDISSDSDCLDIQADNVVIDCGGKAIIGNNQGIGIKINNKQGVTIRRCKIGNFDIAISLEGGESNNILENELTQNSRAVSIVSSNLNKLQSNEIYANRFGDSEIYLERSYENLISENLFFDNMADSLIILSASSQNVFEDNIFDNNRISLEGAVIILNSRQEDICYDNSFVNNDIKSNTDTIKHVILSESLTGDSSRNSLIYSNEFGEIKWIEQLTEEGLLNIESDIVLGEDLNIVSNQISLDSSLLENKKINANAEIKFKNFLYSGEYPIAFLNIGKGNKICKYGCSFIDTITPGIPADVRISVSDLSSGQIGLGMFADSMSELSLDLGWNMVSLVVAGENVGDRIININPGWNLIGLSSEESVKYSDILYKNSVGQDMSLLEASSNNYLSKYIVYQSKDAYSGLKKYSYLPKHSSQLESGKAYWVYAPEETSGKLILKNVKSNDRTLSYSISNLMFRDSKGVLKSFDSAVGAGWINPSFQLWNPVGGRSGLGAFDSLDTNDANLWQGIFLYSTRSDITLLIGMVSGFEQASIQPGESLSGESLPSS